MGIGPSGGASGAGQTPGAQGPSASPSTQPGGSLGENAFLQLLVAQLQYQDPMQPVDSTQFVTQLAQFQMLSVLNNMQADLDKLAAAVPAAGQAAAAAGTAAGGAAGGGAAGGSGAGASGAGST